MLALGFDCWVEKPCYRRKTSLVIGGTRTRVLADSIAIAANALKLRHLAFIFTRTQVFSLGIVNIILKNLLAILRFRKIYTTKCFKVLVCIREKNWEKILLWSLIIWRQQYRDMRSAVIDFCLLYWSGWVRCCHTCSRHTTLLFYSIKFLFTKIRAILILPH